MQAAIVVTLTLISLLISVKVFREAKKEDNEIQRFHIELVAGFFIIYGFGAGLLCIIVKSFHLWGNSW